MQEQLETMHSATLTKPCKPDATKPSQYTIRTQLAIQHQHDKMDVCISRPGLHNSRLQRVTCSASNVHTIQQCETANWQDHSVVIYSRCGKTDLALIWLLHFVAVDDALEDVAACLQHSHMLVVRDG